MTKCDIANSFKTVFTDITLFSQIGARTAGSFDNKSGSLFGLCTGVSSLIVKPFTASLFNPDQQEADPLSKVAALTAEFVAEVGIATLLISTTYRSVNFVDAAIANFLPFIIRSLLFQSTSDNKTNIQEHAEEPLLTSVATRASYVSLENSSPLTAPPRSPSYAQEEPKAHEDDWGYLHPSTTQTSSVSLTVKSNEVAVRGKIIASIGDEVIVVGTQITETTTIPIFDDIEGSQISLTIGDNGPLASSASRSPLSVPTTASSVESPFE